LNTSINALNSFTDIYCISSARSGFVFFISFTNFFLTLICLHHILSGMSCQAWCLVLVAWRYLGYRPLDWLRSSHAGGLIRFSSTILFPSAKSVVIMAHDPGAVVKWGYASCTFPPQVPLFLLDPRSIEFNMCFRLFTVGAPSMDQGSSFLKYFPQQSRHKNCEHDPQFHRRFHKYQLPKLYHLGNPINISTWTKIIIHIQNVILLLHNWYMLPVVWPIDRNEFPDHR